MLSSQASMRSTSRTERVKKSKNTFLFSLGIAVETETHRKSPDEPLKLTPISLVSQLNELRTISDEFSTCAIELEESVKMDKTDNPVEADRAVPEKPSKKMRTSKLSKIIEVEKQSLLKGQAEVTKRNADMKWIMSSHKAEGLITKSTRTLSTLPIKTRFTDFKFNTFQISSASSLSKFFNPVYGVSEKMESFSDVVFETLSQYETQ